MSVSDSRARLVLAAKQLSSDWQHTKESWRDQKCFEFEKTYMGPLETEVRVTLSAMEHLSSLLLHAQHDCQDREEWNL